MVMTIPRKTQLTLTGVFRYKRKSNWFGEKLVLEGQYYYHLIKHPGTLKTEENLHHCWKEVSLSDLAQFSDPIIQPFSIERNKQHEVTSS